MKLADEEHHTYLVDSRFLWQISPTRVMMAWYVVSTADTPKMAQNIEVTERMTIDRFQLVSGSHQSLTETHPDKLM
jgi:hypothetical protein